MKKGYPFIIIFFAVALVAALSLIHWHDITGGMVKDYDLLSDLRTDTILANTGGGNEFVDPSLVEALKEAKIKEVRKVRKAIADSANRPKVEEAQSLSTPEPAPARINGDMVIEDYTPGGQGLKNLRNALARGKARIAVVGDSYIEGDIFTMDLRQQLQNLFGGGGVGYVPAHSISSGFRQTVKTKDSGWQRIETQEASKKPYYNIAGDYCVASGYATVTFTGTDKFPRLDKWNRSSVLFIAPKAGNIVMTTDSTSQEFTVEGSPSPQLLVMDEPTSKLKIDTQIPGLIFLGAWLENNHGITVDCMSNRGDSGIGKRKLPTELAQQMRQYIDYDLIIMEYGINALSATQSKYDNYGSLLRDVALRLRECYPNADILMLAIGDRGQKINGEVHSLPTSPAMVNAQRQAAREAGVLFWDTREAMGGSDAVVDWRNRKLINGDYIHLNWAGGKELATLLTQSITKMLNN